MGSKTGPESWRARACPASVLREAAVVVAAAPASRVSWKDSFRIARRRRRFVADAGSSMDRRNPEDFITGAESGSTRRGGRVGPLRRSARSGRVGAFR